MVALGCFCGWFLEQEQSQEQEPQEGVGWRRGRGAAATSGGCGGIVGTAAGIIADASVDGGGFLACCVRRLGGFGGGFGGCGFASVVLQRVRPSGIFGGLCVGRGFLVLFCLGGVFVEALSLAAGEILWALEMGTGVVAACGVATDTLVAAVLGAWGGAEVRATSAIFAALAFGASDIGARVWLAGAVAAELSLWAVGAGAFAFAVGGAADRVGAALFAVTGVGGADPAQADLALGAGGLVAADRVAKAGDTDAWGRAFDVDATALLADALAVLAT